MAQYQLENRNQPISLYTTFFYQRWTIDGGKNESTVEQASLPLFASIPITKELRLFFSESNAWSSWSDESETLSGIGDAKLKASYNLLENRVLLTGGISLPTGKNSLTAPESRVSNALYQEGLGFKVRRLGEGLNIDVGVAAADAVGYISFGGGVNYLFKGGYESVADSLNSGDRIKYNPGDRITLTGGFDIRNLPFTWQNDAILTFFTPEKSGGKDSFQYGTEIILNSRLSHRIGKFRTRLLLSEIVRGKNKLPVPEGTLQAETNRYGHRTNVSLIEEYRLNRRFRFRGLVEGKRIAPKYGLIYGLGVGMQMQLSRSYLFDIGLKLSRGSIENEKFDVSGLGISFAIISMF